MSDISSWALKAQIDLSKLKPYLVEKFGDFSLNYYITHDSLWMKIIYPGGSGVAHRLCFTGGDLLAIEDHKYEGKYLTFELFSASAKFEVRIDYINETIIHCTTEIVPSISLLIPFQPKDILPLTKKGLILNQGDVHICQKGTRSCLLYFSMNKNKAGNLFYFQNLSSINKYFEDTKTSASGLMTDEWPEIGFSLPCVKTDPLKKGESYLLSDAYLIPSKNVLSKQQFISKDFMQNLADVYVNIPKPEHPYHHWPTYAAKSAADLISHKGCWTYNGGLSYLNAYVGDNKTPAEIMVQLAVLVPLVEYKNWSGKDFDMITELEHGLKCFYAKDLKSIVRWLPEVAKNLDGSEEQKMERTMDSWYLHHPLMNLARMAKYGSEIAKKLLMDSIDYAIKVARHFKYKWPVFYRMDTLYVLKAETQPGEGGEKDVAGAYAHLMLEVWDITGDNKYLNEAKKAAATLLQYDHNVFYQANNTAFAAGALLRLYKITKNELYLDLSYNFIAGLFKNVRVGELTYGNAKYYPNFMAIFPLNDAPYNAAYEEQEVFAGLTNYLKEARSIKIPSSVRMLLAELVKYTITRLPYYYPPLLPEDIIADKSKTGEVDKNLWVPLEDLQDGWKSSGEVGQEVYGAGIGFGVVSRHYFQIGNAGHMIYIEYPNHVTKMTKDSITVKLLGDEALNCLIYIKPPDNPSESIKINLPNSNSGKLKPKSESKTSVRYEVPGNATLVINVVKL